MVVIRHLWIVSMATLLLAACNPPGSDVEFRAGADYMEIERDGVYEPIYVKGINLGVGIPGTYPGQLALDRDHYLRWFERMSESGANVVRIYTLHSPAFYQAFFEYNNFRPDKPLYLMHGIWLDEDPPTGGIDITDLTYEIDEAIDEVIDAVHGNAEIGHRLGRAFGTFDVDISRWVMGYIVGREMYGAEALVANSNNPEQTSYDGRALSISNATPAEVWATERMDRAIVYMRDKYLVERPVAMSNWPTLDPLHHPTEPHRFDDGAEITGLFDAGEDDATLDLSNLDTSNAPAGVFASYHIYPYYPNFIFRDPAYLTSEDDEGVNNYIGYLRDLKAHYGSMPLLVSEYGMPSSWGNAHDSPPAGMNHGGHDEASQAYFTRRLTRNVFDSGCAGGMAFSWMDEWWKRTWIVAHRTVPIERLPFWFDVTSPEENYGLISFQLPEPVFTEETPGTGRVQRVQTTMDAAYFHVRVELDSPLADGETLTLGFDTYRDDLGETVLPGGIVTPTRHELALVITAPGQAQVHVTEAYNLFGTQKGIATPEQVSHSIASDGAPWKPFEWITSDPSVSDDGSFAYERRTFNLGELRVRRETDAASSKDAVVLGDAVVIRIPWVLLQFADPSQLQVVNDDQETDFRVETETTEGVRVTVAVDGELVTTDRYRWAPWDEAPETVEREKPALAALTEAFELLPDNPRQ